MVEAAKNTPSYSYNVGDEARSCDIETSKATVKNVKALELAASGLREGDAAFIRRSDRTWRYALVMKVSSGSSPSIEFLVHTDGSTKKVGKGHWGTRVRTLKSGKGTGSIKETEDASSTPISGKVEENRSSLTCSTAECSPFSSMSSVDFEYDGEQSGSPVVETSAPSAQRLDNTKRTPPERRMPKDKDFRGSFKKTTSFIFRNLMSDNMDKAARGSGPSTENRRASDMTIPGNVKVDNHTSSSDCANKRQESKNADEAFKPTLLQKPSRRARSTRKNIGQALTASSTFRSAFAAVMADRKGGDSGSGRRDALVGSKATDEHESTQDEGDMLDRYVPDSAQKQQSDRRGMFSAASQRVRKSVRFLNVSLKKDEPATDLDLGNIEDYEDMPMPEIVAPSTQVQRRRLSRKQSLEDANEIQSLMEKAMSSRVQVK